MKWVFKAEKRLFQCIWWVSRGLFATCVECQVKHNRGQKLGKEMARWLRMPPGCHHYLATSSNTFPNWTPEPVLLSSKEAKSDWCLCWRLLKLQIMKLSRKQRFSRLFHRKNIQLFQVMTRWWAKHLCSAIVNPALPPYHFSLCCIFKEQGWWRTQRPTGKICCWEERPEGRWDKVQRTKNGAAISLNPWTWSNCGTHCPKEVWDLSPIY